MHAHSIGDTASAVAFGIAQLTSRKIFIPPIQHDLSPLIPRLAYFTVNLVPCSKYECEQAFQDLTVKVSTKERYSDLLHGLLYINFLN
ncbi:MAG: hypothetical protein PUP92_38280 [Rhizonema sp. PD38]|nr:hypothetical protein [Rhizonema sp. PD38]